jgi:hypothetical protein
MKSEGVIVHPSWSHTTCCLPPMAVDGFFLRRWAATELQHIAAACAAACAAVHAAAYPGHCPTTSNGEGSDTHTLAFKVACAAQQPSAI